eukprot:gene18867-6240_t
MLGKQRDISRLCDGVPRCAIKRDGGTKEMAMALAYEIHKMTSLWPHVVVNHLHRDRVDMNRNSTDGTQHELALQAHNEYHGFIT